MHTAERMAHHSEPMVQLERMMMMQSELTVHSEWLHGPLGADDGALETLGVVGAQ